ncbi:MAG: alpha/beta hydrolase [Clostridiales bacterium]|nr:alpha/beta hydrolase [Clostridiales bacterium]
MILAVIAAVGFSVFIGSAVFDGMTNFIPRDETVKNQSEYIGEYEKFASENKVVEVKIPSTREDHEIPAIYVEKDGSKGVAVLVHGMGGTGKSLTYMMQNFLDLGYGVIAYDQRNSGENTADHSTFGVLESYDTLDVVAYARENLLSGGELILWGESYGGATAAIAMGRDESGIDRLILECPVGRGIDMIESEMKDISEQNGIPLSYMTSCGEIYMKFKLGISYADMNPAEWLKSTTKPVLISNSSIDDVTPAYIGDELYAAIPHDKKMLVTTDKYDHAEFPSEDPEGYKQMLEEFLAS